MRLTFVNTIYSSWHNNRLSVHVRGRLRRRKVHFSLYRQMQSVTELLDEIEIRIQYLVMVEGDHAGDSNE